MRELTSGELFLVAGAAAAADVDPSEFPTIVVHPDPPTSSQPIVINPPVEQPGPITNPGVGGRLQKPQNTILTSRGR